MQQITQLLKNHGFQVGHDETLEVPHITWQLRAKDRETVISHYFAAQFRELEEKGYILMDNLPESFIDFERRYFSGFFFREDSDLKWNFYLILLVSKEESADPNICQLEEDDKYLRKLIMTEEELEVYIDQGRNTAQNPVQGITGIDTYAEWQKDLSSIGLEGILEQSFLSSKVRDYAEKGSTIRFQGRPTQNWENDGSENAKFLIQKIENLHMEDFRSHCMEAQDIPLTQVNLISGNNGTGKSSICSAIEYAMTGEIMGDTGETGTVWAEFRNRKNGLQKLKSQKLNKEKKSLDQLWYGTTTMARNSSLNRNFHTFNYLGLEVAGEYMKELEIDELVKNLLFGAEVTEAEQKMRRYEEEFIRLKREYDKNIKEITREIGSINLEENREVIPQAEIRYMLEKLGYNKLPFIIEQQEQEDFPAKLRKILLQSRRYVEIIESKCDAEETGKSIKGKKRILDEKREAYKALIEKREKTRQELGECRQKYEYNDELIKENQERMHNVESLLQQGEGLANRFCSKQDFIVLSITYEGIKRKKADLGSWEARYASLADTECDETELEKKIADKEGRIQEIRSETEMLSRQMEIRKKQTDNLQVLMQEILSLAEQYSSANRQARSCPICGTTFDSGEDLQRAIQRQEQYKVEEDTLFQELLIKREEKKKRLSIEEDSLNSLKKIKEESQKRRIAISELKGILKIAETQRWSEIRSTVRQEMEQAQIWLENHILKVSYAEKVMDSKEFDEYPEGTDWVDYLRKLQQQLANEGKALESLLKEQTLREQKLRQNYEKLMEEKIAFSAEEWEEYRLKAEAVQALSLEWKIDMNLPVRQWVEEYDILMQTIQYAEEIYGKQETYRIMRKRVEKLQEEKTDLEKHREACQKACEVIGRQKRLEDITKDFLEENARQIELFFKLLHRPKEFGQLEIEGGKIRFIRESSGQLAESKQMSTGQRMALAFSVMITLHLRAVNAPNFLMLDEPVANLDDMHILNLIDLLRELAMSGTQIIITTADSQMAKFLRRKFSFLKEEYSHFELTRKGSEKTDIEIIHYVPDKKETQRKQISP